MSTRLQNLIFISLFCSMSLPSAEPSISRVILEDQTWYTAEDGAVAREIASPRNSILQTLSIADIRIPPGTVIKEHHHEGMEEVYWIANGRGIMDIEGLAFDVSQGDSIVILSHERHLISNPFPEELRLHVYCNPPWAPDELYFEPPSAALRRGPPKESRVFALPEQPWHPIAPGVRHRWLAAPENTPLTQLAIAEWQLKPNASHESTPAPGVESAYFVLEGSLAVAIGEETARFSPGETAVLAPGRSHRLQNASDTVLRLHHYENRPQ